jgi:hypothetical protein
MFRDGRQTVQSQVNLELEIGLPEWPKLARLVEDFGLEHALSFRNSSKLDPGSVVQVLALSLCNERGANIQVLRQEWATATFKSSPFGRAGVPIGVYELRSDSGWEALARSLVAELERAWPEKVRLKDKDGRVVPMPESLRKPN